MPRLAPSTVIRRLVPDSWVSNGAAGRSATQDWLAQRTPRERLLLLAGGVTVAIALFVTVVWMPLAAAQEAAIARISILDRVIARARTVDPAAIAAAPAALEPPATTITNTAAAFKLTIRRLESEGLQTRVALEEIRFETLLAWLDALEHDSGLRATRVELERRPEPGVVTARLVLER